MSADFPTCFSPTITILQSDKFKSCEETARNSTFPNAGCPSCCCEIKEAALPGAELEKGGVEEDGKLPEKAGEEERVFVVVVVFAPAMFPFETDDEREDDEVEVIEEEEELVDVIETGIELISQKQKKDFFFVFCFDDFDS